MYWAGASPSPELLRPCAQFARGYTNTPALPLLPETKKAGWFFPPSDFLSAAIHRPMRGWYPFSRRPLSRRALSHAPVSDAMR